MIQNSVKSQKRKPTIGLIINTIERTARHINGQKVWLGVMDAVKERDVNLLCFHVDFMSKEPPHDTAKTLYKLIDEQNVDGLIISLYWDQEKFNRYCERFASTLPIVNIRRQFEGFPTVIQDDYQGMKDAITHLVREHNYQKIAYVRGAESNVPSQNRYRAYINALTDYAIPLNSELVTPWNNINASQSGREAVQILMDERKLRPGLDFEAIAVSNDRMARGVLEALAERKVRIPYDVGVIAFDDLAGSEFTIPPLTTMALPYYEMAKQAAETLLSILEGSEKTSDLILIPPNITVRQSCGCLPAEVKQIETQTTNVSQAEFQTALTTHREAVITAMIKSAEEDETVVAWTERILDAFAAELKNGATSGNFLEKLDEALRPLITKNESVLVWQAAISAMRKHLRPYLQTEVYWLADDLWQQAFLLIDAIAHRAQKHQMLLLNDQAQLLHKIGAEFGTLFEINQLMDKLAEDLPKLGIPGAYLSLYDDPKTPEETARLILAYTAQGRIEEIEGTAYPSRELLPGNLLAQNHQTNYVIESLHFRDKPIGFAIFEIGPLDGNIYANLGEKISSALQGALMVNQMQSRAKRLQASVEVTQAVSKILDPNDLIQQVVNLIRDRFNLYFVGLYLIVEGRRLDPNPRKYAQLQAGTGEVGQKLVEKDHRLEVGGNSLIGQCVATGEACIALDMNETHAHIANPLLPETRSELALPLISRGEVIGALDLQSARKSAFDQEDAAILQTMAGQLASAIENARLFSQAEEAMNKLQSELKAQVRQGWNRFLENS